MTEERETRAALLIVHGIGEQNPFETLDHVARGLVRHHLKRGQRLRLEPRTVRVEGDPKALVRLSGEALAPYTSVDLYELYWAGRVQGRITVWGAFLWLLRTGLAPLNFREQLPAMLQRRSRRHVFRVVAQEALTALLLLLGVLLLAFLALIFAVQVGNADVLGALGAAWSVLVGELQGALGTRSGWFVAFQTLLLAVFGALGVVALYMLTSFIVDLLRTWQVARRHVDLPGEAGRWRGMYAGKLRAWLPYALFVVGLILLTLLLLYPLVREDLGALWRALWGLLSEPSFRTLLLLLALGGYLRWLLVTYVGDIALYVTSDQKSAYYRTREEIKEACTALLQDLLTRDAYNAVFLAGHSLGSVIAYDCLNQLSREARSGVVLPLEKLRGLLTFGSPLDKVVYFFRQQVGEERAVRAQLLSYLHATRRHRAGRDYGPYLFEPYTRDFDGLHWVNLYSAADLISSPLDFYQVEVQHDMGYWNPFTAHNAYWQDGRFYTLMSGWLKR